MQSNLLAFLRVKLRGENVVAPNGRREVIAVIRPRGDDARIRRLRIKAVHEIDVAAVRDAAIERTIRPHDLQLVPADLRNLMTGFFREAHDFAAENAEASRAGIEFLATLKQRLITDANAEKGFAGLDVFFGGFEQTLLPERMNAIIERADAGEHEAGGVADLFGMLHEAHVGPYLEQGLVHAA